MLSIGYRLAFSKKGLFGGNSAGTSPVEAARYSAEACRVWALRKTKTRMQTSVAWTYRWFAISLLFAATISFCGCSSYQYVPPTRAARLSSSVTVKEPFNKVWSHALREMLAKSSFVVNSFYKPARIINVSFSGLPSKFVNCGEVHRSFGLIGPKHYSFPGAKAKQDYLTQDIFPQDFIQRELSLTGRAKVTFEEVSPSATRVTVNAHYVLKRTVFSKFGTAATTVSQSSISFDSDGKGSFSNGVTCYSNGTFEKRILSLVTPSSSSSSTRK